MRVGGERGCLIEDRLPHHDAHSFAYLVVAKFEVFPDLVIRDAFQAGRSKAAMSKKWRELKERHSVCRERIQRVAKQFVGARAEMVEVPASFENFGELCDADEVGRLVLQRVETNRELRIA